jgi:hypothetical protein
MILILQIRVQRRFKGEDYFNLNLYHTINEDNNNVVGISKSDLKFKDNLWF